jgi:hypothetical protein
LRTFPPSGNHRKLRFCPVPFIPAIRSFAVSFSQRQRIVPSPRTCPMVSDLYNGKFSGIPRQKFRVTIICLPPALPENISPRDW